VFDLVNPDGEDQPVRDYLQEHQLEPRRKSQGDYEGRQCESMQFGGCYLGKHLQKIGEIQRHAVETEVLTEEIQKHLVADFNGTLESLSGDKNLHEQMVPQLVQKFHPDSVFQTNDVGELDVTLDEKDVMEAARRIMAESERS
jgi:hypothetical protein